MEITSKCCTWISAYLSGFTINLGLPISLVNPIAPVEASLKIILIYLSKSWNSYYLWVKINILLTSGQNLTFLGVSVMHGWSHKFTWKWRSSTYWYQMTCKVLWNSNHWFMSFHVYKWLLDTDVERHKNPIYTKTHLQWSGDIIMVQYNLLVKHPCKQ